jgi:integral membrane protein
MNIIKLFRIVALAEGISFMVLLCIAMPLKYVANMPEAVRITGMLHGVLFITYIILAWESMNKLNKKWSWFFIAVGYSVIPFGAFYLEKQLKNKD